jgi:hypothetical protein
MINVDNLKTNLGIIFELWFTNGRGAQFRCKFRDLISVFAWLAKIASNKAV